MEAAAEEELDVTTGVEEGSSDLARTRASYLFLLGSLMEGWLIIFCDARAAILAEKVFIRHTSSEACDNDLSH